MTSEKKPLVVKSNRVIEASYRLSLTEQRLVLLAVMQARVNQTSLFPDAPVTIRASDFASRYSDDEPLANVYAQLKEGLKTLYERSLVINDTDPETKHARVTTTRWISSASYIDGSGNLQMIFAPLVIPYLTKLEREFTSYDLRKIGKLSSAHAVRLYELLLQYKPIEARSFEISKLRETIGLLDEYKLFGHLKARVIDVAVDQINKHTDIKVKYETRKTGRKITHLDFTIKEKSAATSSRPKLDRAYIDKNARPGETYEQARDRLAAQRDKPQQNLID
jgi:plasmid replication initiation protein